MPAYDLYLPFGELCLSSGNLRSLRLQFESFPFDWVVSDFNTCSQMLQNRFAGWLRLEDLERIAVVERHDRYRSLTTGVEFVHDFPTGEAPETHFEAISRKYATRIDRLYQRIADSESIMFVTASYLRHEDAYYLELFAGLQKAYPQKKLALTSVEILKHDKPAIKLQERTLGENIRRFDLLTPEVNNWAPLRPFYAQIFKSYRLTFRRWLRYIGPDLWFRAKKTALKLLAAITPVPSLRRSLKQKTKRKFFE